MRKNKLRWLTSTSWGVYLAAKWAQLAVRKYRAMDFLGGSDSEDEGLVPEVLRPLADEKARADALSERPDSSGVLVFHTGIENAMLLYVERITARGRDADSVLLAVDNFCYTRHWMMHVSSSCAVELGSYCGYSSVVCPLDALCSLSL